MRLPGPSDDTFCRHYFTAVPRVLSGGRDPGGPAGRPGPEKVVPSDRTKGVQYLATQEETRVSPALHGPGIDLGETHPSTRDLRLLVALVARPRQLTAHQHFDEP